MKSKDIVLFVKNNNEKKTTLISKYNDNNKHNVI